MNLSTPSTPSTPSTFCLLTVLLLVGAVCLLPSVAHAGVGGAEFDDIYDKLVGYAQGTPGRIVMFLGFVVAAISAVVAQSIAGFVVGLGIGLGVYYANKLVEGVVTATLPLPTTAVTPDPLLLSPEALGLTLLLTALSGMLLSRHGRAALRSFAGWLRHDVRRLSHGHAIAPTLSA